MDHKTYFYRQEKNGKEESRFRHIFRWHSAIGLGIFATIATAGTWWYAAKHGASLWGYLKAASVLRTVSIVLMGIPALIFNTQNPIASIDKISRSDFGKLCNDIWSKIKDTYERESFLRFINIPRACEKIISYTGNSILFLLHVISIALMSDGLEGVPPAVTIPCAALPEALTDAHYMPDDSQGEGEHQHKHTSIILKIVGIPFILIATTFKILAVGWDLFFSKNIKESCRNIGIFYEHEKALPACSKLNDVSSGWRKQEVRKRDNIMVRLKNKSPEKIVAAQKIKNIMIRNEVAPEKNNPAFEENISVLNTNRSTLWKQSVTRSKQALQSVLENYEEEAKPSSAICA